MVNKKIFLSISIILLIASAIFSFSLISNRFNLNFDNYCYPNGLYNQRSVDIYGQNFSDTLNQEQFNCQVQSDTSVQNDQNTNYIDQRCGRMMQGSDEIQRSTGQNTNNGSTYNEFRRGGRFDNQLNNQRSLNNNQYQSFGRFGINSNILLFISILTFFTVISLLYLTKMGDLTFKEAFDNNRAVIIIILDILVTVLTFMCVNR